MVIPLNAFDREEHDGDANAKNISIVKSNATLYAVVNTGAAGVGRSLVTVLNPVAIAGNVTIDSGNIAITSTPTIFAVVNTDDSLSGNVTVEQGTSPWVSSILGNVTIEDGGVALTVDGSAVTQPVSFAGNVTIQDGGVALSVTESSPISGFATSAKQLADGHNVAIKGNVTINGTVPVSGTFWQTTQPVSVLGNVTLSNSKTFIGLATVVDASPIAVIQGMVSSASGGLVQFPANAVQWLTVKAAVGNATTCYVGSSSATINNAYPLDGGDTVGYAVNNSNNLYLVGVGDSEVRFTGG